MGASRDFGASTNDYSIQWTSILSSLSGHNSTVAFWTKSNGQDTSGTVWFGTNNGNVWWQTNTTTSQVWVHSSVFSYTGTITDDTWRFLAFTSNASPARRRFYIDGTLAGSAASTGTTLAAISKSFMLGRWIGGTAHTMDGLLGQFHFYDRELSADELDEIRWRPGTITNGLQIYTPLYGVDSPEPDLSGNGLDGTVNSATASTDGPPVSFGLPTWIFPTVSGGGGVSGTSAGVVNETTSTGAGTTTVTGTSAAEVNGATSTGAGTTTVTGTSAGQVNAVTGTGEGNLGETTGTSEGLVNAITGTGAGTTTVTGTGAGQVNGVTSTGAGTSTITGTSAGEVNAITSEGAGSAGSISGTSAGLINGVTGTGSDVVVDIRRGGGVPPSRKQKPRPPEFERRDREKAALREVIEAAYARATGEQREMPDAQVAEVRRAVRPFSTSRAQVRLPRPSTVDFDALAEDARAASELMRALEARRDDEEAAAVLLLMAA